VSSPLNNSGFIKRALLVCFSCIAVFDAAAIDSIELSIGQLIQDEQTVSDIQANIQINDDSSLSLIASGIYLQRQYRIKGQLQGEQWQASSTIKTTPNDLLENYQQFFHETLNWQVEGDVELNLSLSGTTTDFSQLKIDYHLGLKNLTGDLSSLAIAVEGLDASMSGSVRNQSSRLQGNIALQFDSGLFAYQDMLLEPLAGSIQVKTNLIVDDQNIRLSEFNLNDPGGLQVNMPLFSANIKDYENRHQVNLNVTTASFPHVYQAWMQPLLYGTVMEELETEGNFTASIKIANRKIKALSYDLQDFSLSDNAGRFSLYQLSSQLQSLDGLENGKLLLSWQGAELYRLLVGGSEVEFTINNQGLAVNSPFTIPVYDGELKVFKLSIDELQGDHPIINFDGILTPVNLSALSGDMGWPTLDGSLSGVIPSVRYDKSGLAVDGVLLVKAFDGTFKIQHLKVSDLLSPLPHLSADFSVDQLDLEKLTRTFDFGRIEGKLSGYIAGLNMVAWQANSFDAFFYTPQNDESKHIISQRAVDNLTSLSGSDIGSILSRSYLRFFENFRYDRLGVGCILRNNVCRMNGIEAATGSAYYIVKGGFLPPRLDIIGYSNEVDWNDLLGRLERVISDNAPVIQ